MLRNDNYCRLIVDTEILVSGSVRRVEKSFWKKKSQILKMKQAWVLYNLIRPKWGHGGGSSVK
jgi:hypothetical protein